MRQLKDRALEQETTIGSLKEALERMRTEVAVPICTCLVVLHALLFVDMLNLIVLRYESHTSMPSRMPLSNCMLLDCD